MMFCSAGAILACLVILFPNAMGAKENEKASAVEKLRAVQRQRRQMDNSTALPNTKNRKLPYYDYYYNVCKTIHDDTVLDHDISCNCTSKDAAVLVLGGATLDLNGHHVKCEKNTAPDSAVILVKHKHSTVQNGHVTGNGNCILLRGSGKHTVQYMYLDYCGKDCIAVQSEDSKGNQIVYNHLNVCDKDGIQVASDRNKVLHNELVFAVTEGLHISGNGNYVAYNDVYKSGREGVLISGHKNRFKNNFVTYSYRTNVEVSGTYNKIQHNTITSSGLDGIHVTGSHNTIGRNAVSCSADDGIALDTTAAHNYVFDNKLTGSGDDSLDIEGNSNYVKKNRVAGSFDKGLLVEGHGNYLHENVVFGSGHDTTDLFDANPDCNDNEWKDNYGSANQDCIA